MKNLANILFIGVLILTGAGSLQANEENQDRDEHVVFNSKPLSPEKKKMMEERRAEEANEMKESVEEGVMELAVLRIPIKNQGYLALTSNEYQSTAASYTPGMYNWIDSFPQNNIIKLQDGSEWVYDPNEAYLMGNWRTGDTLTISPKGFSLWDSNYTYVLNNKDAGTSVSVNPFLGPIAGGTMTTWIIGKDIHQGQVYLINGIGERSVWEISHNDLYLFDEWEVGQAMILGENTGWMAWFSSCNAILINVERNHYVRGRLITAPTAPKPVMHIQFDQAI